MFGFFSQMPLVARVSIPDSHFGYQTPSHLEVINQRIERFKQAQTLLESTDRNITTGLAVGSVCWVGTYLFPLVTVSIAGFCFAAYNASRRSAYFNQYKEALDDLIKVYEWSMGKETDNHLNKLATREIQSLILTLGPRAHSKTIHTWGSDDLKSRGTKSSAISDEFEAKLKEFTAGTQTANWEFRLYGEGATDDFLGIALANIKKWASDAFTAAVALKP